MINGINSLANHLRDRKKKERFMFGLAIGEQRPSASLISHHVARTVNGGGKSFPEHKNVQGFLNLQHLQEHKTLVRFNILQLLVSGY